MFLEYATELHGQPWKHGHLGNEHARTTLRTLHTGARPTSVFEQEWIQGAQGPPPFQARFSRGWDPRPYPGSTPNEALKVSPDP